MFPDEIDEFGNPKVDIQTADIPDIDDFQYFKAKAPRSAVEGLQLMQLRELLADKVILARDINHLRNAVIEIEKFLRKLSDKVDDLERRVEKLERETVIDGKNLGNGEGIFESVSNRIMNFKSIKGEGGITISSDNSSITIEAPEEPEPTAGCGTKVWGDAFEVCDATFPMRIEDGSFSITDSGAFSFKMVNLIEDEFNKSYPSLLIVLGQGQNPNSHGAGRILKTLRGYIFEIKNGVKNEYSGLEVTVDNIGFYPPQSTSKINAGLKGNVDVYDMSYISNL